MAHFINQLDGSAIVSMAESIHRKVVIRDRYKAAYEEYIKADANIAALKKPYETLELEGIDLFKVAVVNKVENGVKKDGTPAYKTIIKLNPLGYDDQGRFDLDILKQRLAEQENGTAANTATEPVFVNPNEGTVTTDVEADARTAEPVDTAASAAPAENSTSNTADGVVSASGASAAAADVDPFESL